MLGYAPVVDFEDLGEHVRDAIVAVRDEYRVYGVDDRLLP
jgi:hypothetical protein